MVKTGRLQIIGTRTIGDIAERSTITLNIVTNDNDGVSFSFVNKEHRLMEISFDEQTTWEEQSNESETDYKVYVDKTVDDIVDLYKLHTENTLVWLTPLTEVVV